jgi:hypothetical protein
VVTMRIQSRSRRRVYALLGAVFATMAGRAAFSGDTAVEQALLTDFSGGFQWDGSNGVQLVDMRFVAFTRLDEQRIEVRGCGRYDTAGLVTSIRVKMIVDEETRRLEIWEADPVGSTLFETGGSHKGSLDDDLMGIQAEWTTSATGAAGKLRLRAGGNLTCSPQVAFAQ